MKTKISNGGHKHAGRFEAGRATQSAGLDGARMKPTNAQLRERANAIAAIVAPAIGLEHVPKCHRITRRRGYGSTTGFSVPVWAAAHELYFNYYAAHEVCHAHPDAGYSHGAPFRAKEALALAALNLAPVYQNDGAGPYVDALTDLAGNVVCVRPGKLNPCDPPYVYTESPIRNEPDKQNASGSLT